MTGGVDFSPLEVMFGTDLDRRGGDKTEGDNGLINGMMSKLALCSIDLKGTELPIRPPVVGVGKGSEEDRRI